ncbi:MAG TPA: DUF2285 domain-containing protein [Alphaproteobacteria bacterium]|nr:DUF2285 domain-containing protein [Alphaproteobacteria bacterium]
MSSLPAEDGVHFILSRGTDEHHLWLAELPSEGVPLTVAIDLTDDALDQAAAMLRFWRAAAGIPGPGASTGRREPSHRRVRLIRMLRALDGRLDGASYREIATALFGAARVADEPWKTSSLRATTIRLVAGAYRIAGGGYRDLLRPAKHRPNAPARAGRVRRAVLS